MNPEYKNILLPIDASGVASGAMDHAITLARTFGASLRIVHVIDPFAMNESSWTTPRARQESLADVRIRALQLLNAKAQEAVSQGVAADTALLELDGGHGVSERLVAEADAWPADLIVLGTHARRGLDRLALGSVAEGVARLAQAPALLVRGTEQPR